MRLKFISFFIIIILLVFILSGCISDDKNSKKEIAYDFYIKIDNTNGFEYDIIIPLSINRNESISKINDYLEIEEGNGNIEYISTKYGYGLKIKSNTNLKIISKGKDKLDIEIENNKPQTQLSLLFDENNNSIMDEYNKVEYWLYLNSTNNDIINVEISLIIKKYHNSSFTSMYCYVEGQISNGWQKIEGKKIYKSGG